MGADLVGGLHELRYEAEGELRLDALRQAEADDEEIVAVLEDVGAGCLGGGADGVDDELRSLDHGASRIGW